MLRDAPPRFNGVKLKKLNAKNGNNKNKSNKPSFCITSFGLTDNCGPLRVAATIAGYSYQDLFVSIEEHTQSKAKGDIRWNTLPELTVFGKSGKELVIIGQVNACLRYIGMIYINTNYSNTLFLIYLSDVFILCFTSIY